MIRFVVVSSELMSLAFVEIAPEFVEMSVAFVEMSVALDAAAAVADAALSRAVVMLPPFVAMLEAFVEIAPPFVEMSAAFVEISLSAPDTSETREASWDDRLVTSVISIGRETPPGDVISVQFAVLVQAAGAITASAFEGVKVGPV